MHTTVSGLSAFNKVLGIMIIMIRHSRCEMLRDGLGAKACKYLQRNSI